VHPRGDTMVRSRPPVDSALRLSATQVNFKDGTTGSGTKEGNNAAWHCNCDGKPLLVGRCYYQFGDTCYTKCAGCGKVFRVRGDAKKRATFIDEV